MQRKIDYTAHNKEVKEVWDSFNSGNPIRIPSVVGISDRYFVMNSVTNPEKISFYDYSTNPELMFKVQQNFDPYVREMIPGDHEMGIPEGEVPYALSLLREDNNNQLFYEGIPDSFSGLCPPPVNIIKNFWNGRRKQ